MQICFRYFSHGKIDENWYRSRYFCNSRATFSGDNTWPNSIQSQGSHWLVGLVFYIFHFSIREKWMNNATIHFISEPRVICSNELKFPARLMLKWFQVFHTHCIHTVVEPAPLKWAFAIIRDRYWTRLKNLQAICGGRCGRATENQVDYNNRGSKLEYNRFSTCFSPFHIRYEIKCNGYFRYSKWLSYRISVLRKYVS